MVILRYPTLEKSTEDFHVKYGLENYNEREREIVQPKHRLVDNIKMYLEEIWC
jgi:hypothetical protein